MRVYSVKESETIETVAKNMVSMANETNDAVVATFNKIDLKTGPSHDPEMSEKIIITHYDIESARLTAPDIPLKSE